MHILTGTLSGLVVGTFTLASMGVVGEAVRRTRGTLGRERVRLFGLVAAGVFAAQLLNWPLPGGTSAHFVGGALAGILLGPATGVLAVALVVTVQAAVFADGGLVVLGANVWNMAVVDVLVGYAAYRALTARAVGESVAVFAAAWVGVTAAALSAGVQIGLSPAFGSELARTVTTMTASHAALGVVEAAITVGAVRYLRAAGVPFAGGAVETGTGTGTEGSAA